MKKKNETKKKTKKKGIKTPEKLYAFASVKSNGGSSMFEKSEFINSDNVEEFYSEKDKIDLAEKKLRDLGFEVLHKSDLGISIAAPIKLYEEVFKTNIKPEERKTIKSQGKTEMATYWESDNSKIDSHIDTSSSSLKDVIEGIAIETPVYFMSEAPLPPHKSYHHLNVPDGVGVGLNAARINRTYSGKNIKVCIVDTGFYRHSFYTKRGYNVSNALLGPGTSNPTRDDHGHGTGEAANIFSVAPRARLIPIKMSFVSSIGGFNLAVAQNPQIITCSWGSSILNGPLSAANQALAASIAAAVARGIIVVFSAGNGHFGFPGQHPDVISAGGVYRDENGNLRASDYSSGFASRIYPGRKTPDVSGLVGMKPRAAYIMLPVQRGCTLDVQLSGGTHPNRDETTNRDGWAAFSGTSAAAPQIAGACAVIRQAYPNLSPSRVRAILKSTAIDVTVGTNNNGNTAGAGYDLATGAGLINVEAAGRRARLRYIIEHIIRRRVIVRRQPIGINSISESDFSENDINIDELEELFFDSSYQ